MTGAFPQDMSIFLTFSATAGEELSPITISTNGISVAGSQKCAVRVRSGCLVFELISVILNPEVLLRIGTSKEVFLKIYVIFCDDSH